MCWGALHYSMLHGVQPYPSSGFEIHDSYQRAGIAGGLSSPVIRSLTVDYGLHVNYAWMERDIVGDPLNWIGTRKAKAVAFGFTGRVRYALSDGFALFAGMDTGYQLLLDQRMETYSFADRSLNDVFYVSVVGGLWLRLQAGDSPAY